MPRAVASKKETTVVVEPTTNVDSDNETSTVLTKTKGKSKVVEETPTLTTVVNMLNNLMKLHEDLNTKVDTLVVKNTSKPAIKKACGYIDKDTNKPCNAEYTGNFRSCEEHRTKRASRAKKEVVPKVGGMDEMMTTQTSSAVKIVNKKPVKKDDPQPFKSGLMRDKDLFVYEVVDGKNIIHGKTVSVESEDVIDLSKGERTKLMKNTFFTFTDTTSPVSSPTPSQGTESESEAEEQVSPPKKVAAKAFSKKASSPETVKPVSPAKVVAPPKKAPAPRSKKSKVVAAPIPEPVEYVSESEPETPEKQEESEETAVEEEEPETPETPEVVSQNPSDPVETEEAEVESSESEKEE